MKSKKKQQAQWAAFFERFDVLLAPVSPTAAFEHKHRLPMTSRRLMVNGRSKHYFNNLTWTVMAIVSGLPATVAPVGETQSGLPVGVQIIADRFEDRTTIDFARGLSEIVGGCLRGDFFNKRLLIFYSLFALFVIGGSFILSLYIIPRIFPHDIMTRLM